MSGRQFTWESPGPASEGLAYRLRMEAVKPSSRLWRLKTMGPKKPVKREPGRASRPKAPGGFIPFIVDSCFTIVSRCFTFHLCVAAVLMFFSWPFWGCVKIGGPQNRCLPFGLAGTPTIHRPLCFRGRLMRPGEEENKRALPSHIHPLKEIPREM